MPKQEQYDWTTDKSSGLPDKVNVHIAESYYANDPRYNEGKTLCLIWTGTATSTDDDGNDTELDLAENPILISCGDKWDSPDGGKTAEHDEGKTKFNARSHLGMIIDRCVEEFGMGKLLGSRGPQTSAEVWEGLNFYMEREEFDYGKRIGKVEKLMPVKFLGEGDAEPTTRGKGGKPASSKPRPAAAKVTPAAKKAKPAPEPEEEAAEEETLEAQVFQIARDAESYPEFMDKSTDLEGIMEDSELLARVLDKGDTGIWAEVQAE